MHNPIQLEARFALKLSADVELLGRRLRATKKNFLAEGDFKNR